jgi:alpha-D-ribose 1-methylphosphonate 5-triphosphate synthase subunit PhnH
MSVAAAAGFSRPVFDAQTVFRTALEALANPGRLGTIAVDLRPPPPLSSGLAALALALCDFETPIFLTPRLAGIADVGAYVRFHTGARLVDEPQASTFAFIDDPAALPAFESFAHGTLAYPDRSTTLVIAVDHLNNAGGWRLRGPGIDGFRDLDAGGPAGQRLTPFLAGNRRLFPRGVDIFLVADRIIAGLPRSTQVE